ncbi:hypothetical protein FRX31_032276, partial [Thalictrum thalictroides]
KKAVRSGGGYGYECGICIWARLFSIIYLMEKLPVAEYHIILETICGPVTIYQVLYK